MIQRPTSVLRSLVKRGKFLELPAAFDPLTARIVEAAGFKSIYNGGFVTGGMSAISEPLLTMTEQIGVAANIAATVKIPVVMDAGAGWGEPLHTMRTVRECIRNGIAGVPVLFWGAGVRRGAYSDEVRTVDMAPTLAAILGIKPTEPLDGVVLVKAVRGAK